MLEEQDSLVVTQTVQTTAPEIFTTGSLNDKNLPTSVLVYLIFRVYHIDFHCYVCYNKTLNYEGQVMTFY